MSLSPGRTPQARPVRGRAALISAAATACSIGGPTARVMRTRKATSVLPGLRAYSTQLPRASRAALPAASRTFRARSLCMSTPTTDVDWSKELLSDSSDNNVTPYIANLVGRDLHLIKGEYPSYPLGHPGAPAPRAPLTAAPAPRAGHPLNIIKTKIEDYFCGRDADFERQDSLYPIVTPTQVPPRPTPSPPPLLWGVGLIPGARPPPGRNHSADLKRRARAVLRRPPHSRGPPVAPRPPPPLFPAPLRANTDSGGS